jgi:dihydroorotate dehydrogenase (fumarate)
MSNLQTTYLGIPVASPIVVASSTLSANVDRIRRMEDLGAGAVVVRSIFEEQIQYEVGKMEDVLAAGAESYPEALSYLPILEHADAREHIMWVEKTREAVKLPLIGSVNAVSGGKWADYAKQLAAAGVNAIELNVYAVEADPARTGRDVEARLYETFEAVRNAVKLPIAVKLSPFYSALSNVVAELEARGAQGVVCFNRFLQPDIDVESETLRRQMSWSRAEEMRLPLRWIALLAGRVKLDLIASTGVEQATDVAKYLLAGAQVVQVASTLFRDGVDSLAMLNKGLHAWMDDKGYASLADFRGKVSQRDFEGNLFSFERAQYVDFLLSQKG